MERVLLLVGLGAAAVAVAALLRSRVGSERPTRPEWSVPDHLDRAEFQRADAPWLVAVFTSPTCLACQGARRTSEAFRATDVAVQAIDSVADAALHDRYGIEAVPLVLIADAEGTVRASFAGEPTPEELGEALDRVRSQPPP